MSPHNVLDQYVTDGVFLAKSLVLVSVTASHLVTGADEGSTGAMRTPVSSRHFNFCVTCNSLMVPVTNT